MFFLLWNYVMDDAFITFKYAQNFIEYFKPYYNVNSDFQGDGQTSFLWFIILTIPFLLKISPIFFYSAINYILSSILIYLFAKNTFTISSKKWLNYTYKFLAGTFFSFLLAVNAKHGLETILYIFLLVMLLKNWRTENNTGTVLSILLFLTRPEGIVFTGIYALSLWKNKKLFWKNGFIVATSLLLFIAYKIYYFDELVPLPFIFKSSVILDIEDVKYFVLFLILFLPVLFHSVTKKQFFYAFPLAFFLLYYSFGMERIMGFGYRFSFPLMAYLIIPFHNENLKFNKSLYKTFELGYVAVFCLIMVSFFKGIYFDFKQNSLIDYSKSVENAHIYIGKHFSKDTTATLLISDAGAMAYYSNANCYDSFGLNDALFLKYRIEGDWDAYFKRVQEIGADYFVLLSGTEKIYYPAIDFENQVFKHYQFTPQDLYMERKFNDHYFLQVYSLKRFNK
jgi:hypothetical protein